MTARKLITQFKKSNIYQYLRGPCVPLSSPVTTILLRFVFITPLL